MSRDIQPPTGDRIAAEVERELQERRYPLRQVTLVPAEYHIYLHPEDFSYIEPVVPRIVDDIQTCLNTLVERLNKRPWSRIAIGARQPPVEVPVGGWVIYIKPAVNEEVDRGEIGIHSRLAVPAAARFGSGAGTVRITETIVSEGGRRTATRTEPALDSPAAVESAAASPNPGADREPRPLNTSGPRLDYTDQTGPHTYVIVKDLTKIGRGGTAHWVDVTVTTGPEVSREHCRVRHDGDGRFFLQDVSSWGTFLNGNRVAKYVDGDPAAIESELADGAQIRLADAVTLEFHAR